MQPVTHTDASEDGSVGVERFSLVAGGPLYQLMLRARLARPHLELVHRRVLLIPAIAWLPLLLLTLWEGTAFGGVVVPFLTDVEAYARFLIAIPILLVAERVVHNRLNLIIAQFRERGIVSAGYRGQFEQAIASAMRWRDSIVAETALLAVVFVASPFAWKHGMALQTDTWYAHAEGGRTQLTAAGWWFVHVSAPIFQFLLIRWYYRLAIWWRYLWQVSRLPLELKALHPDRAGGIGFLGGSIVTFIALLFAQSTVVSGIIFSRVLTGAGTAMDFRGEILLLIAFLIVQIVGPLLFFAPDLLAAQERAKRRFGLLATVHAQDFERKWLDGVPPTGEVLLGSADVSSLADLAGSNDVVREMRSLPFSMRVLARLAAATAAPFFPLVLTVIPFGELMQRLLAMLL